MPRSLAYAKNSATNEKQHVRTYVYVCIYIYVLIHAGGRYQTLHRRFVLARWEAKVHAGMHTCAHTHTHASMCVYICIHIHILKVVCIYTSTNLYVYNSSMHKCWLRVHSFVDVLYTYMYVSLFHYVCVRSDYL